MRGKAQPNGRPALQIIKTPFLYFSPLLYWKSYMGLYFFTTFQ